jgi:DUF4097 and DUF4098 domain-containing protein YvlB
MSELQKVIKYCAIGFAAFLAFSIITGILTGVFALSGVFSIGSNNTVNVSKSFENVKSLTAEPGVGNFTIKVGDSDKVEVVAENVNENFTAEKNFSGNLKIKDKFDFWNFFDGHSNNGNSKITIYVPVGFVAEKIEIDAGAGNVNIDSLSTKKLDINAGAGNITGSNITADEVKMDGGVGEIRLDQVNLTDVDINSGVGNVNLQGSMYGKNKIDCGVGEVKLTLTGSVDDYDLTIDKGLGSIYINDEKYSDLNWNNNSATNSLDIDGGVGDIEIDFE